MVARGHAAEISNVAPAINACVTVEGFTPFAWPW
jgi:hypothetical protein